MNVYNSILRLLTYVLSPSMPVVSRLFGNWHIDGFTDHPLWEKRHPSLMLSLNRRGYDWDVSLLVVDMLRRWAYSVYSNIPPVMPKGFTVYCTIKYDENQPHLICIVLDEFNTAYVICRGTLTLNDIIISTWDVHAPGPPPGPEIIHSGYKHVAELCLREIVLALDNINPNDVVVTGHSLGAAVGILLAQQISIRGYQPIVYAYGIPRFVIGSDYKFHINSVICSDDHISLGKLFCNYRHVGNITFTEGVSGLSHTIDSYYSSVFFGGQREITGDVEDLDVCTIVD